MSGPAAPVEPVPAATVLLLRDAPRPRGGIEVFLIRRSPRPPFPGLHVFPGGQVDPMDSDPGLLHRVRGISAAEADRVLGVSSGGLATYAACVRECLEEAAVPLLATREGVPVARVGGELARALDETRARSNAGEAGALLDLCRRFDLVLAADRLVYLSHWITPEGAPRRFDTRFFAAAVGPGERAAHDGSEAVEGFFLPAAEALRRGRAGELSMISPTLAHLEMLRPFPDVASFLAARRAVDPATIPTVRPRFVDRDGEVVEVFETEPGAESRDA